VPEYLTKDQEQEIQAASGFRVASEEDAKLCIDAYKEYKSARAPRYRDQVENDNFYHNVQYTPEQRNEIIARGQAPLEINVTYSIIKQIVSLLTSENPTWYVDPVTDADKGYAYTMRSLLNATWYNSRGGRQFSQIAKSAVVAGVGYAGINPTTFAGQFGVQFKHIPYAHVYPSPNIREFDGNDAENWIISKHISHQQASELLSKTVKEIEEYAESAKDAWAAEDGEDSNNNPSLRYMAPLEGHKRIRVIQRLSMENQKVFIVKPNGAGAIGRKIYFSLPEIIKKQRAQGLVTVEEAQMRVLAKYISIGKHCQKYYIPISTYNIVPFIDEFNDNPYPLGEIDFLMPLQKALNKFMMLTILNATLANNMKMLAPEGSIDPDYYQANYAVPGSLLTYKWSTGMPEPKQINPLPFSGQFFEFPQFIIHLMEYITGIFGVVQGNPEGAPRTASGLMSLQNYGGQKVRLLGRNMNDALSNAGDVAIEMYQNYAPYNGLISYFEDNEVKYLRYNTLEAKDGGIAIANDISIGKYKTRCVIKQNYGSERELKANMLANLAAQTKSSALIKPILKLADIPEVDEIIESMDELTQANQTIQQQQQTIERMNQINQQLENQVIAKGQQVKLADFSAELAKLKFSLEKDLAVAVETEINKLRMDLANVPTNGQE